MTQKEAMNTDKIIIRGAREHNLKNIDVEIPRNKLVVITGLSGSGKSTLAFDTLYAEGQRRYVESLSAYARQFLEQMEKPSVDEITGLSPAIAIQQRAASHNPRSTVATVTEIYDYLRVLFARIGVPFCYKCGRKIQRQSVDEIISQIMQSSVIRHTSHDIRRPTSDGRIDILGPLIRGRKGEYRDIVEDVKKQGFIRVRIDGTIYDISEELPRLAKYKKHDIEVVVDRIALTPENRNRLADSLETALKIGKGLVMIQFHREKIPLNPPLLKGEKGGLRHPTSDARRPTLLFSEQLSCPKCSINYEEISPRSFSFNSPYGACPGCLGLGAKMVVDPDLVVPDKNKSVNDGAIEPWSKGMGFYRWKAAASNWYLSMIEDIAKKRRIDLDVPFARLPKEHQNILLVGSPEDNFEGVITNLERRYKETDSENVRRDIYEKYISYVTCSACKGDRLKPESLSVRINGRNISEIARMPVKSLFEFFADLKLNEQERVIAREVIKEIRARLGFLVDVGLDYLTLDRTAETLSGGEAQRVHLATQIGSGLVGVLYILDEPTIGLHQRDNKKLLSTLVSLRNLGNTVIVVEHDKETIMSADHVIDLGPGPGIHGGRIVAEGTVSDIIKCPGSLTGKYLKGELAIKVPGARRKPAGFITIEGASQFNLKDITAKIPLGIFTCVTGVSGSGKSTLVNEIFYKALAKRIYNAKDKPGRFRKILGAEKIDKIIIIDQSPIGRTPRSNPATYTGAFAPIRDVFAMLPESKARGYLPGRFSFNVKGGRCEACQGDGVKKVEMHFLADVYVTCEVCKGARYNRETLEIRYKGRNISEVLDMILEEALEFFKNIPRIHRKLRMLNDVGLGYIKVGQFATTLSGGEAQRVKLATELSKIGTGRTIYILDEPTTGLHFADVDKLLSVLHRLTDAGNTVIVIEHNLEVIKTADYVIDLGPEGGDEGGRVVAKGTPEEIAGCAGSYTGQFLKKILK